MGPRYSLVWGQAQTPPACVPLPLLLNQLHAFTLLKALMTHKYLHLSTAAYLHKLTMALDHGTMDHDT